MERIQIQVLMRSDKVGYFAHGIFDGRGVTVLKGSKISDAARRTITDRQFSMRQFSVDESGRTKEDLYFKSPSAASNFVCGRSSNGWVEWVTPAGEKLIVFRNVRDADRFAVQTELSVNAMEKALDIDKKEAETEKPLNRMEAVPISPEPAQHDIKINPEIPQQPEIIWFSKPAPLSEPAVPVPAQDPRMEELMRQVAQMQDFIMRQPSTQISQQPFIEDRRYHIAAARVDAPLLRLASGARIIDALALTLTVDAIGNSEQTATFQAFFLDANFEVVSNAADIRINGGESASIHFSLSSRISQEKRCYLAFRDKRDVQDELLVLIPFDISMLFMADFGF